MKMRKKEYKSPRTKVVAVVQSSLICASPAFTVDYVEIEELQEDTFEW